MLSNALNFFLILVPSWSIKDLELISSLSKDINSMNITVYLMDIDQFKLQEDISSVLNDIPNITQTPVVAIYENGCLGTFVQGEDVANFNKK